MNRRPGIPRRRRKPRLGLLFAIVAGGLMVTLTAGSGMAANQPTEAQILQALKAKHLTRCPQPSAHSGCGGAQPQDPSAERRGIDVEITFDYGSANLRPEAMSALLGLGSALGDPEIKNAALLVLGHTDASGTDPYNRTLSVRRAAAVKQFLIKRFHLRAGAIETLGFGQTELKNAADPFAAENRRVQIVSGSVK